MLSSPVTTWMVHDAANKSPYVVTPEEAPAANMAKIIDSAEFMGKVVPLANTLVQNLQKESSVDVGKMVSNEVSNLQQQASESKSIANFIENEAPMAIKEDEIADELSDYYRSLADITISSKYYEDMTREVNNGGTDDETKSLFDKVWSKITWFWDRIKKKVDEISRRIKGLAAGFGQLVSESLVEIRDSLSQTKEKIIDSFSSLSDRFHDFIIKLTDQMFKFLTRFGEVAKLRGYSVSQIDITIPSVKFEFVNLFFISIPIPKIDPPDITVSIQKET
jgi:gas vesicle protein